MSKLLRLASISVLAAATLVSGRGAVSSASAASIPNATPSVLSVLGVTIVAPATRPATRPAASLIAAIQLPFEREIVAFEAADRKSAPTVGGILFYGSSSIRLWKSLSDDFNGLKVLNRGFGGSTAPDALRYTDRMVLPLKPSVIVFYEGDNDLSKGRTPEQLLADYQSFEHQVHAQLPKTRIIYLSVKPSPKRIDLLATQKIANTLLEKWINQSKDARLSFVDTFKPMLDLKGLPRAELFGPDHLHMNHEGYKLWTKLIALPAAMTEVTASAQKSK